MGVCVDVKHWRKPLSHALFSDFVFRAPRWSGEHCCGIFGLFALTTPGRNAGYFVDASSLLLRTLPLLL